MNNVAFIDGANLYQAVADLGWRLDYRKFRRFLKDKYHIEIAYLFIGFLDTEQALYTRLQESGYVLVFKPTLKLEQVLIPNESRYSALLKKINESGAKYFSFLNRMRNKLEFVNHKK